MILNKRHINSVRNMISISNMNYVYNIIFNNNAVYVADTLSERLFWIIKCKIYYIVTMHIQNIVSYMTK
jgi:hypothetical protein